MSRGRSEAFGEALILGVAGLVLGGIVGWAAGIAADDVSGAASWVGGGYLALVPVLPLLQFRLVRSNIRRGAGAVYAGGTYRVVVPGALFGALAASGLFLIPTTNLPSIVSDLDEQAVRNAIVAAIGWWRFLAVVGVTTAAGALIASRVPPQR